MRIVIKAYTFFILYVILKKSEKIIMLKTPFGEIKIFKNRKEIEYVAELYTVDIDEVKENHLAGCYRITIDFEENDTIICQLFSDNSLIGLKSACETGEDYICCHIEKDNTKLTIGTVDTINNMEFVGLCLQNGLILPNLPKGKTKNVVFGISWVNDLSGECDVRTYLASDPTYF